MFKRNAKLNVLILVAIPVLGVAAAFVVPWFIAGDMEATYHRIAQAEFHCPEGTTEAIEPWGKAGYMRFCKKGEVRHGPWMAWEAQYRNIQGEYREGKQHGLWTVWNKEGSKFKIIEYRDRVEIREETLN